ncbi:MAG: hypothetical protein LBE35_05240 [Clostridiales bacterium]|jgi:niacin transporter|nr:hypothetical protein [Clostridiales bacterium]
MTKDLKSNALKVATAGLLIAIGVLIPLVSPLRLVLGPASYTLGSHIAIFVAMFISPGTALAVTMGTTVGFFLGGFPIIIVWRAASHIIFVALGLIYLSKIDKRALRGLRLRVFSLWIGIVHGLSEAAFVLLFFMGQFPAGQGPLWILAFIGAGSLLHSLIDFEAANIVRNVLYKAKLL